MRFVKMEGFGNDFVVVEGEDPTPAQVRSWCDRRRGIGADGVLSMGPELVMRYWNADGGAAQMCGNGLRCLARRAVERGWAEAGEWFEITTAVGERRVRVLDDTITAELGRVEVGDAVEIEGRTYQRAWVGNPHAVTVVDDPTSLDVAALGTRVGADPVFPEGANVEFVAVDSTHSIRMRVWERGVGETLACGSGIVVAAGIAARPADGDEVTVRVPGGTAYVHFEAGAGYITGPARTVFSGTWL